VELAGVAKSDLPLSDSMRSKSWELAGHCIEELNKFDLTIPQIAGPVLYWLRGKLCTQPPPQIATQAPAASTEHQAFAESVKPSKDLVSHWQLIDCQGMWLQLWSCYMLVNWKS
jgi:hypothetical protein